MLKKRIHKNITWYDFFEPTKEEFSVFAKQNNINEYIVDKFIGATNRDKTFILDDHLFISLSFPNLKEENYEKQSVKFIIGKDKIWTSQSAMENEGLIYFSKMFESNISFEKDNINDSCVAFIFLHMIDKIYENAVYELVEVQDEIDEIEKQVYNNQEKKMVKSISDTNRKLINFRKNLKSHNQTWKVFLDLTNEFFNREEAKQSLNAILLSYRKTIVVAEQLQELLWELRDTNNSLLQAQHNQTSKEFTLIAFMTLPITLFVSIVSIQTNQIHIVGVENDFYIILAVSFIIFIVTLSVSKWKKWW